jgi:hypothetical protein
MDDERSPLSSSISSCTGSTRRRAIAMANGVREFARQFLTLRARPEKGLSGQGSRDSKRVLKPNLEARDVDPDHSAAV